MVSLPCCFPAQEAARQDTLAQLKQSLSAPAWDPEDQEWRPLFLPHSRLPSEPPPASQQPDLGPFHSYHDAEGNHQRPHPGSFGPELPGSWPILGPRPDAVAMQTLCHYLNRQAELEQPRQALRALQDPARTEAYRLALMATLIQKPGDAAQMYTTTGLTPRCHKTDTCCHLGWRTI